MVAASTEPDAFLQARLYPNMFPLMKQVQIAAEFARGISARLSGVAVPVIPSLSRLRTMPIGRFSTRAFCTACANET